MSNDIRIKEETSKASLKERLKRDREPLDFSPSSTATDPESATKDQAEDYHTGRFGHTENATFAAETLEAESDRFRSLNQINRQNHKDDEHYSTDQDHADLKNDARAWGRRIGLLDHEIERAAE